MVDHARAARMAKRIQQIVATAIEREIKDPRLEYLTITDARVTGDLHDATVFYTVRAKNVGDEPNVELAKQALEKAKGQLRRIVGEQLSVRFTPTLSFSYDSVPEVSAHMEDLLAQARARDEEIRQQALRATPAGEQDPYKLKDTEGQGASAQDSAEENVAEYNSTAQDATTQDNTEQGAER